MYTLQPLGLGPNGWSLLFVVVGFVFGALVPIVGAFANEEISDPDEKLDKWFFLGTIGIGLFVIFVGAIFPNTNTPPKNEEVRGTLVDSFESTVEERHGKRTVTVPSMHVIYRTPSGDTVTFRRGDGRVYPREVILYKN